MNKNELLNFDKNHKGFKTTRIYNSTIPRKHQSNTIKFFHKDF